MIYFVLFLSVLGFSGTDFLARKYLGSDGLHWNVFYHPWFWLYVAVRVTATGIFMYALSQAALGRSLIFFSMFALIISVLLGYIFLHESVGRYQAISLVLALTAIGVMLIGK